MPQPYEVTKHIAVPVKVPVPQPYEVNISLRFVLFSYFSFIALERRKVLIPIYYFSYVQVIRHVPYPVKVSNFVFF